MFLFMFRKGNVVERERKKKMYVKRKKKEKEKFQGKAAPIMSKIEISNIVCATTHIYIKILL